MVAPRPAVSISLSKAADTYLDSLNANVAVGSRSPATVRNYAQNLRFMVDTLGGEVLVDDVTGEDIDRLLVTYARAGDRRRKNPAPGVHLKAPASQKFFHNSVYAFFTEATKRNWCQLSPFDHATVRPGRGYGARAVGREALTPEQAQALLEVGAGERTGTVRAQHRWLVDKCLIASLIMLGTRTSELSALNWTDFTPRAGGMFVRVTGKGGKIREIPVDANLWALLAGLQSETETAIKRGDIPEPGGDAAGAVFVSSQGFRVNPEYTRRALRRAQGRVAANPATAHLARAVVPHGLRHTAGTMWLASGEASLAQVRDLLGHENVATTSLYLGSDHEGMSRVASSTGLVIPE